MNAVNVLDSFALYLHIPFCGTRCTYCAFNTYTNMESLIPAYVDALCHELSWLGHDRSLPVRTIYFGGGTPSLLTPTQVEHILNECRRSFNVAANCEITLEANPGSIDDAYLDQVRATGVNRLSLGMQSAHAQELRLFARQHDTGAVAQAVEEARQAGFDNVNLDLIYGVPNQTLEMWRESVSMALSLRPDHLSMYALGLEAGTAMTRWVEAGTLPAPDDDLAADMYDLADQMAHDAGLHQYEISNWARSGYDCQHNLQYWRNAPYLGVGAGAHGYAAGLRYEVVRPIQRYIDLAAAQESALPFPMSPTIEHSEPVDHAGSMAEHMMTGLRLIEEGIRVDGFRQRFGADLNDVYGDEIDWLLRYDLLRLDGGTLRLAPRARLLSNQVFLRFMA